MKTSLLRAACVLALLAAAAPALAAPPSAGVNQNMTVTPGADRNAAPRMTQGPGADTALGLQDQQQFERIRQEAQGNYAPLDRTVGLPLGTTQDAWSKPMSTMSPGQTAPGVVRFNWSPELVMPIRVREYFVTMIVLPPWEQAANVISGDHDYIQSALIRPNVVAVRTGAAGLDTTLDIVGKSGNLYTFYIRAETYNTKTLTDVNVFVQAPSPPRPGETSPWFTGSNIGHASFVAGAADAQAAPAMAAPYGMGVQPAAGSGSAALALPPADKMIFNLRMYEAHPGDRSIAPELVYTDGVWTYFDYGSKGLTADRPVVYRLVDGVETIVNTRTAGAHDQVLVAEAVGEFVLRDGQKTICVKQVPAAKR